MTCTPVIPCANTEDQIDPLTGSGPLAVTPQGAIWELLAGGAALRTAVGADISGVAILRAPCSCGEAHMVSVTSVTVPGSVVFIDAADGDISHAWQFDPVGPSWTSVIYTRSGAQTNLTPLAVVTPVIAGTLLDSVRQGDTATLYINGVAEATVDLPGQLRGIGGGGIGGQGTFADFSSTCVAYDTLP